MISSVILELFLTLAKVDALTIEKLIETYKNCSVMRICLNYYVSLISNYLEEKNNVSLFRKDDMTKFYTTDTIDKLSQIWTSNKISIVLNLTSFLSNDKETSMEAVKISNLSYKYPSADEYCLKNVSFSVSEGEVCAIVGPNGCGKTTICNIIRGLIPSFHGGEVEGSVEIFGKSTKEISEEEKAKRIGFVFQNPFTQNSGIKETVFEEIAFGLENMGVDREEIITKVMDIISLLQIEAFMFKHPCELSGGQRQRVALASIIVQDPDIIVIDEPTSQLDPKGTEDVFEIIKYLNRQKKTIVLVEHKMNLIAEYADHIVYLNDGSVLLDGSPEDVLSSEILYEKNLDMPYVAVLGFQARSRGLFIDKIPTTVDEALKIFTECVQKSKGGSDGCGLS